MENVKAEGAQPSKLSDTEEKSKSPKDEKSEKVQDSKSEGKETLDSAQEKKPIKSPTNITVKELFNQAARISNPIKKIFLELEDAKAFLAVLENAHAGAQDLVKPQKLLDKRLGGSKKIGNSDERKLRRTEKKSLDVDLILQREKVDRLQEEFTQLCGNERKAFKYRTLQVKAESKKYVRENKSFLLSKAKKLLEASLTEHRDMLHDLGRKAKTNSEDGVTLFNSSLRELLFIVDEEGAILCSGTASKTKIYSAVRKALQTWNPRSNTIPDLVWPKDGE